MNNYNKLVPAGTNLQPEQICQNKTNKRMNKSCWSKIVYRWIFQTPMQNFKSALFPVTQSIPDKNSLSLNIQDRPLYFAG